MLCTHQEFRGPIPYGYHDLVTSEKRLERLITEASKTEITNFDNAFGRYQDVCGLEVTM
jgi:hypothetical protein